MNKKHGFLYQGDKFWVCLHQSHYYPGRKYTWAIA